MSSTHRNTPTDEMLTIVERPTADFAVAADGPTGEDLNVDDEDEGPDEVDDSPGDDADIAEERIEAFAEARGDSAVDRGPFDEGEERERRRERVREALAKQADND